MKRENEIKARMEVFRIVLTAAVGTFILVVYGVLTNIDKFTLTSVTGARNIVGVLIAELFLGWVMLRYSGQYINLGIDLDRELEKKD